MGYIVFTTEALKPVKRESNMLHPTTVAAALLNEDGELLDPARYYEAEVAAWEAAYILWALGHIEEFFRWPVRRSGAMTLDFWAGVDYNETRRRSNQTPSNERRTCRTQFPAC